MSTDRFTPVAPRRRAGARPHRSAQHRTGLVLLIVGLLLFVASNLGARAGFSVLPFDPHHVLGQLGGPAVALLGASLMGRRRR